MSLSWLCEYMATHKLQKTSLLLKKNECGHRYINIAFSSQWNINHIIYVIIYSILIKLRDSITFSNEIFCCFKNTRCFEDRLERLSNIY